MTLTELGTLLSGTGLSVAYHHFKRPPGLPFVVYYGGHAEPFTADNKVLYLTEAVTIEYYSDELKLTDEALIEAALDTAEIIYTRDRAWIPEEEMFQTVYSIEI